VILCDHREQRSTLPKLLAARGIELEILELGVGDYQISSRILLERKASDDFVESIKDGRLFEQASRLRRSCSRPLLLIEGDPTRIARTSLQGALAALYRMQIPVLRSNDLSGSADWIETLYRQESRPKKRQLPIKVRLPSAATDSEIVLAMLSAIPGVSLNRASDLLNEFGDLASLLLAEPEEIAAIPGIGPASAEKILRILKASYAGSD